jgi:hypothetical protein
MVKVKSEQSKKEWKQRKLRKPEKDSIVKFDEKPRQKKAQQAPEKAENVEKSSLLPLRMRSGSTAITSICGRS